MANQVWQDLKEKTEFWANGDIILEKSQNYQTKLLTLVIMEDTIKVNYKMIFFFLTTKLVKMAHFTGISKG